MKNNFLKILVPVLIFVFGGLIQYAGIFHHEWSFDDFYILESMPESNDFKAVFQVFTKSFDITDYRPVSMFSYAMERYFKGDLSPEFSHKVNLLLYIISVFVIYILISKFPKINIKGNLAILVAILFLFLPIHASIVSSLKNRDGLLSLLFGLFSIYFFLQYITYRKLIFILFYALFLVGSVLSKLDAVGFIPVSVVLVLLFHNELNLDNQSISLNRFYFGNIISTKSNDYYFESIICLCIWTTLFWSNPINEIFFAPLLILFFNRVVKNKVVVSLFLIFFLTTALAGSFYWALSIFAFIIIVSNVKKLFYLKFLIVIFSIPITVLWHVYTLRFKYINNVIEMKPDELPVSFTENPLIVHPEFSYKISQAIQTYFHYIKFMIIPKGYYFYFGYDMLPLRPLSHPITLAMLLVIILLIVIIYFLGSYNKLAWFGGFWFFATLLYASNLYLPVAGIIADRYAYIASAGYCMVLAVGIMWLSEKLIAFSFLKKILQSSKSKLSPPTKAKKVQEVPKKSLATVSNPIPEAFKLALVFCLIICLIYTPFTISRAADWKNVFTLIEADMPYLEKSYEAHRVASTNYIQRGMSNETDPESARQDFLKGEEYVNKALAIYDGDAFVNESQMIVKGRLGKTEEAFELAKSIAKRFDYSSMSRGVLADTYFSLGKYDSAAIYFKELIALVPKEESLYYKYTNTLRMAGREQEAVAFAESLRGRKDLPAFLPDECIYYVYFYNMQMEKAIPYFEAAYDKGLRNSTIQLGILSYYVKNGNVKKVNQLREKYGLNRSGK